MYFINEKINTIKNSSPSKLIYKFDTDTHKNPNRIFHGVDKQILKFILKEEDARIAKTIVKNNKERKLFQYTLLYYKPTQIQVV